VRPSPVSALRLGLYNRTGFSFADLLDPVDLANEAEDEPAFFQAPQRPYRPAHVEPLPPSRPAPSIHPILPDPDAPLFFALCLDDPSHEAFIDSLDLSNEQRSKLESRSWTTGSGTRFRRLGTLCVRSALPAMADHGCVAQGRDPSGARGEAGEDHGAGQEAASGGGPGQAEEVAAMRCLRRESIDVRGLHCTPLQPTHPRSPVPGHACERDCFSQLSSPYHELFFAPPVQPADEQLIVERPLYGLCACRHDRRLPPESEGSRSAYLASA
jgi:hypothetical protein